MKPTLICTFIALTILTFSFTKEGEVGSQGPRGVEGEVGQAGEDGSIIHAGNEAPDAATGKAVLDSDIDLSDYEKISKYYGIRD